MENCVFCKEYDEKSVNILLENNSFWIKLDPNPVSKGHILIISKRHIDNIFKLTNEETKDLLEILKKTREYIDSKYNPTGYNVGVNIGEEGGQTIFHLHVHFIPRYKGDVPDTVGGIRNVIPGKGNYKQNL